MSYTEQNRLPGNDSNGQTTSNARNASICDFQNLFEVLVDFTDQEVDHFLLHLEFLYADYLKKKPSALKESMAYYSSTIRLVNAISYHRKLLEEKLSEISQHE